MRMVVLGGGEVGRHVSRAFSDDADIVLVDRDATALQIAEDELDVMTLCGDVTHRSVLEQAEISAADVVLTLTGSDAVNVTSAVLASALGARRTIARVDAPGFYEVTSGLERDVAGVDACICASRLIGGELLRRVTEALYASFTGSFVGGAIHVASVELDASAPWCGRPASRAHENIRAVVRGASVRGCAELDNLEEGDRLLLVGRPIEVAATARVACAQASGRAVLVGGGDVGFQLAKSLEQVSHDIRVIDPSRERCEQLAELLPQTTILHGDGTNLPFLREERIGLAQLVISVTHSDEVNLMASLLSRELGADRTFALVHRPGYAPVYHHLGIAGTTSAHEVLVSTIRSLLPGRRIVSSAPLSGTDFELIEIRTPRSFDRPQDPRSLPLGPGSTVLAVVEPHSAEVRKPSAPLEGGEHLLVASPRSSRRALERALARLSEDGT